MQKNKLNEELSPSQTQLKTLLDYFQKNLFDEAEKLALSITQEFPNHQFAWKVLGALSEKAGRIQEALNANLKALKISPKDAEAHNNLGNTFKELGRLDEAEASYKKAIALDPDHADAYFNLGRLFKESRRFDEAKEYFNKTIYLKPDNAFAYNDLGTALDGLGKLEEAEPIYRKAIKLKPDFAEAHNNLGITLEMLGRLEEAQASIDRAVRLKPHYATAHYNLSRIKKFTKKDEQFLTLQGLYQDENISEQKRCFVNFSLAKAQEDLQNFEQAYLHYSKGNALRKKILQYDFKNDIKFFDQIKRSSKIILKNSLNSNNLENTLTPIFIVGMPRSGTSLVEQIISSHSQVTGAGELNFINKFGGHLVEGLAEINIDALVDFRKNYIRKLQYFSEGKSFVIDKLPQNFCFLGLIASAIPEAKIIHVKRNPAAVCWANYKQYFTATGLGYSYSLDDIVNYYKLYKNLMEHWIDLLGDKIYDLDYELLVNQQESETRKIIEYLNLNWDPMCLSPQDNKKSSQTASSIQVRKKIYKGSSHQWLKYESFLDGAFDCFL